MKKHFLARVNILLGAISIAFAGCHSNKSVLVKYGAPDPIEKYGIPEPEVVAMYGVPSPVVEEVQQEEPIVVKPRPTEPEPPVCKYGVPMPFEER